MVDFQAHLLHVAFLLPSNRSYFPSASTDCIRLLGPQKTAQVQVCSRLPNAA